MTKGQPVPAHAAKRNATTRWILFGFVAAIAGLLASGLFMQWSIREVKDASNLRAEARKAASRIRDLNVLLVDAETSQRGFLLTGDETYLEPYESARKAIPELYGELGRRLSEQPDQILRLRRAETLVDRKLSELAETISLKRAKRSEAALRVVTGGGGKRNMDELREVCKAMADEQERVIAERNATMERVAETSATVMLLDSLAAVAMVALLSYLLLRNTQARSDVERSLLNANSALETKRKLLQKVIAAQNEIALAPPEPRAIMDLGVRLSMDLTGADGSLIEVVDGHDLVYHHVAGAATSFLGMRIPRKGSFSGLALERDETLYCRDSEIDGRVNREACRKVRARSLIVVPLQHRGRQVGVLKNYSSKPEFFDEDSLKSLSLMCGLLSAALAQADEFEEKNLVIEKLEGMQRDLIVSRDEAHEATQAKSRFLANMSHEVRTPLNAVLGMTGLLLDAPLQPDAREYANAIKTSGESLLQIVNDILDFSKAEAGRLVLEQVSFDLVSTLQDVIKSFSYAARQKGLGFSFKADGRLPAFVKGDPGRIRQILMNLIGNAIKFTQEGSVSVRAICEKADESEIRVRIEISDTGIGIDPATVEGLFREFVQADASTTRRFGGTGLGLAISKGLVERMSGQIGVRAEMGKGSTFWFTLGLAPGEKGEAVSEARALEELPTRGRPWRVLVGEDNRVNQVVIAKVLEKLGIRADVAGNGREVIESLRARPYDLILMDCHMPEMDGYDATAFIRNDPSIANNSIPIIAMTANAMPGDRERTIESGMDDYIAKPLDLKKIRAVLIKWLNRDFEGVGAQQGA